MMENNRKSKQCCHGTGGNETIDAPLWFSSLGNSGNCFLHSTVWSEKQRTERIKDGEELREKNKGK